MKSYPWFKSYPKGIPHEIQLYEYQSVVDLFETNCKKYAESVAFENMGARLTYGELDKLSRNFAAYLQHGLGLKREIA